MTVWVAVILAAAICYLVWRLCRAASRAEDELDELRAWRLAHPDEPARERRSRPRAGERRGA